METEKTNGKGRKELRQRGISLSRARSACASARAFGLADWTAETRFRILSNSIDEAREGHGKVITLTHYADGSIEVEDNGRGCPRGLEPQRKKRYNWGARVLRALRRRCGGTTISTATTMNIPSASTASAPARRSTPRATWM